MSDTHTHTHVRACTRCPSDVCTYKIVPYYFVRCSKYYCLNPKNKFSNYLNLTSINNYLLLKFEALIFMASNQVYGMYTHKYVTNVSPEWNVFSPHSLLYPEHFLYMPAWLWLKPVSILMKNFVIRNASVYCVRGRLAPLTKLLLNIYTRICCYLMYSVGSLIAETLRISNPETYALYAITSSSG